MCRGAPFQGDSWNRETRFPAERQTWKATNLSDALIVIASLVPRPPRTSYRGEGHLPRDQVPQITLLFRQRCLSAPLVWAEERFPALKRDAWCVRGHPSRSCPSVLPRGFPCIIYRKCLPSSLSCTFSPVDQTGRIARPLAFASSLERAVPPSVFSSYKDQVRISRLSPISRSVQTQHS